MSWETDMDALLARRSDNWSADMDTLLARRDPTGNLSKEERQSIIESMPQQNWLEQTAGQTTPGLIARSVNRAMFGPGYTELPPTPLGPWEERASALTSLVVDPATWYGARGAGAVGRKLLGQEIAAETVKRGMLRGSVEGATLLGGLAAIHDPMQQYVAKGEVDPVETASAVGQSTALGAALGPVGRRVLGGPASLPAEAAVFAGGQAAMELRAPTTDDFLDALTIVGGIRIAGKIDQLRKRLKARGPDEDPKEIAKEVVGEELTEAALQKAVETINQPPSDAILSPETALGGEPGTPVKVTAVDAPEAAPGSLEAIAALADQLTITRREWSKATGEQYKFSGKLTETERKKEARRAKKELEAQRARKELEDAKEKVQDVRGIEGEGAQQEVGGEDFPRGGPAGAPLPQETEGQVQPRILEPPPSPPSEPPVARTITQRPPDSVGISNAALYEQRLARGVEQLPKAGSVTDKEAWSAAEEALRQNPNRGAEIVADFAQNPKQLGGLEELVLLRRMVDNTKEHARAMVEWEKAKQRGDVEAEVQWKEEIVRREAELTGSEATLEGSGHLQGQAFRLRQFISSFDYDLSRMIAREAVARNRPVTDAERAEIKELHDKLTKAQAREVELTAKFEAAEREAAANKATQQVVARHGKSSRSSQASKDLKAAYDNFVKRSQGKLFSQGIDPETFAAAIDLARASVRYGIVRLQDFLADMRKRLGDERFNKVRPTLEQAWQQAVQQERPGLPEDVSSPAALSRYAGELADFFVSTHGIREMKPLVDAIHGELAKVQPGITWNETLDAFSRIGQFKPLDKDEMKVIVRELRGQALQTGKLRMMREEKKAPPKTGLEYPEPGPVQQQLIKEVNEAKKRGGYTITDVERQLQSFDAAWAKRIRARIEDYRQRKLERVIRGRRIPPPEIQKLQQQAEDVKNDWRRRLHKVELANQNVIEKAVRIGLEIVNLFPALRAGLEWSYVLRQGKYSLTARPLMARKALRELGAGTFSRARAGASNREILSRKNAPLYKRAKLPITDPEGATSQREEQFAGEFHKYIPGYAQTARGSTAFLNRLRADHFDTLAWALSKDGRTISDAEAKVLANAIGDLTGRADTPRLQKSIFALARAFFSPRLVWSRFRLLALNPIWSDAWRKGNLKATYRARILVAKEMARSLVGVGAYYSLIAGALYAAFGAPGEDKYWNISFADSNSPDFGMIRIGTRRIDILAGVKQAYTYMSRMLTGRTTTQKGKDVSLTKPKLGPYDPTRASVTSRFIRGKLHPTAAAIWDALEGENFMGERVTPLDVGLSLVAPISYESILKALLDYGVEREDALHLLELLGEGVRDVRKRKAG